MCFFRKGLKTLEAVEPHVKLVTEQQHIDYKFSGLEDDDDDSGDSEDEDNGDSDYNVQDDGELSFDYGQNYRGQHVSTSAMEVRVQCVLILMEKDQNIFFCVCMHVCALAQN